MNTGIYAGSFDPVSNGHIDIIKRSLKLCDNLILAIGVNPAKKTLFSEDERWEMLQTLVDQKFDRKIIAVKSFEGLLVEFAKESFARVLIRGIRSVSDFEYEINLANVNKVLAPEIETVFLPADPQLMVVSSSAVKEIAKYGADISKFVPDHVAKALKEKYAKS